MKPINTMNIAEWHGLFKLRTATLADHTRNPSFVKEAMASINQIKPALSSGRDALFTLHAHLYVLGLLLNRTPNAAPQPGAFIGFHTHAAISDVGEALEHLFENKPEIADEPAYWPLIEETVGYLRSLMLTDSGTKPYFTEWYLRLWRCWISPYQGDASRFADELRQLQSAPAVLGPALSEYPWLLAQSWLCFYLKRDEEAQAYLIELNKRSAVRPEDLFPMLEMLQTGEDWQRLKGWLVAAAPLVESARLNNLKSFYQYWDGVIAHIPQAEQLMWEPLVQMLPYTNTIYEEKLLHFAKWQQWIDFQISKGSEPLDYRVGVLAPIEKETPELLLPFFHQAAERYVLLKNRHGYKMAVKLLKRLSKLYKKMKNEERWETYITAFAARNSRLRALQEELRKGKLIP
ncbi:hypothetical protein [Bacillus sp. FJAT-26390]|uniref:hypothetical protein n=1 Tax=Bacillus sp. FJAT-26390 TaxID=1743142 RepID=UPI000807E0ED|nr:hypothetical protein [Bacillus sp. FJAT-26390]OBZ11355.1 hypothetical protein A7975_20655 [Bacillus sp. FJAT-26390]